MSYDTITCCVEECFDKSETSEKSQEGQEVSESQTHRVPAVTHRAPAWCSSAIIDSSIRQLSSTEYDDKYLVLLFYPYDFSFSCPSDLIQFNDCVCEFEELGAAVVAISTDSEFVHYAWTTTARKEGGLGKMKIPMLSDRSRRISRYYGVLDEERGICLKALFVIDKKQIIRHITINEITLPRSANEVLRVIQACQFVDKYGDVCPMGPKERIDDSGEPNYFCVTNDCN